MQAIVSSTKIKVIYKRAIDCIYILIFIFKKEIISIFVQITEVYEPK